MTKISKRMKKHATSSLQDWMVKSNPILSQSILWRKILQITKKFLPRPKSISNRPHLITMKPSNPLTLEPLKENLKTRNGQKRMPKTQYQLQHSTKEPNSLIIWSTESPSLKSKLDMIKFLKNSSTTRINTYLCSNPWSLLCLSFLQSWTTIMWERFSNWFRTSNPELLKNKSIQESLKRKPRMTGILFSLTSRNRSSP